MSQEGAVAQKESSIIEERFEQELNTLDDLVVRLTGCSENLVNNFEGKKEPSECDGADHGTHFIGRLKTKLDSFRSLNKRLKAQVENIETVI